MRKPASGTLYKTRYATLYSTYAADCPGAKGARGSSFWSADYPIRVTSALTWAIDIASICVVRNEFPWVVVKALISATVRPPIAATLSAGRPVVLDSAAKLVVVIPAICVEVKAVALAAVKAP